VQNTWSFSHTNLPFKRDNLLLLQCRLLKSRRKIAQFAIPPPTSPPARACSPLAAQKQLECPNPHFWLCKSGAHSRPDPALPAHKDIVNDHTMHNPTPRRQNSTPRGKETIQQHFWA
jgi:hypothetical protein